MSKRKLKILVEKAIVDGWDDPRMPTISGFRRRGYTPDSIKDFMEEVGVAKRDNVMDVAKLESSLRTDLNKRAMRRMAVLDPLKVVITNYPEGSDEYVAAKNNPEDESAGTRDIPFSRELFIEKNDFMEDPPKKYFRLSPGKEVRLKFAYFIKCNEVVKDENGDVVELHCTYDKNTKGGKSNDGRKVKGTLHWVSALHAVSAEVRLYDRLFKSISPDTDANFLESINSDSLKVLNECKVEPYLASEIAEIPVQFERLGYFIRDSKSSKESLVFNRTVALRDTWKQ